MNNAFYYLPGLLLLAAQIFCLIHLVRQQRSLWWLLPLFFFPFFGVLLYGLLEVYPDWRAGEGARAVPFGSAAGTGRESIGRLERELARSPTVENRTRLAAALLRKGETKRAVALYEDCLEGLYAEDKNLWYEIAEAYHADGQMDRSLAWLEKLEAAGYRDYRDRRELLHALALEAAGAPDEALRRLGRLVGTFTGQEANYHYARLLFAAGQKDKATRVVQGMFERRKNHDSRYRRREARWYRAARKLLD